MNRYLRTLCLLAVVLSLSGCGTRTAYNNLDWLTQRWVNQQVDLHDWQREQLDEMLEAQLAWHCATQLADYQAWIEEVRMDLLAGRLDRGRIEAHGETMAGFARALADQLQPALVELAAGLDDDQVEQLISAFGERIEAFRESVADTSEQDLVEERLARMERGLRRLMGRPNAAQRERLADWSESVVPTEDYQLQQRLYWQERIGGALARRDNREFLSAEIGAFLQPDAVWSDEYRHAIESNRELTLDALEDVLRLANDRQRTRLSTRLYRLQRDFGRLSCEGEAPPELLAAAGSA